MLTAPLLRRRGSMGKMCKTPGLDKAQDAKHAGNFVDGVTFETFAIILAGVCGVLTFIVSTLHVMLYAIHYSKPKEQKHVMRMISMLPFFALISFGTTFLDRHNAQYLHVILDLYESFVFATFFLLVCFWIEEGNARIALLEKQPSSSSDSSGPSPEDGALSSEPSPEAKTLPPGTGAGDSPVKKFPYGVPRIYSGLVFQFPLIMIGITVVTVVTNYTGHYCVSSDDPQYAHIWVGIVQAISTSVAFTTLAWLGHKSKGHVTEHHYKLKFLTFKSIVFILLVQNLIFSYFTSEDTIPTTTVLTRTDISVRVPAIILALEMVFYSVFYHYVFPYNEFRLVNVNLGLPPAERGTSSEIRAYQGGFLGTRALWQAAFATDLVYGAIASPVRFYLAFRDRKK